MLIYICVWHACQHFKSFFSGQRCDVCCRCCCCCCVVQLTQSLSIRQKGLICLKTVSSFLILFFCSRQTIIISVALRRTERSWPVPMSSASLDKVNSKSTTEEQKQQQQQQQHTSESTINISWTDGWLNSPYTPYIPCTDTSGYAGTTAVAAVTLQLSSTARYFYTSSTSHCQTGGDGVGGGGGGHFFIVSSYIS